MPSKPQVIYPTQEEFRQFENAVEMTSDEARELVRESWKTQTERTPRLTVDSLIVNGKFFFSIERQKLKKVRLTGYYVDPETREVTFKESTIMVERR